MTMHEPVHEDSFEGSLLDALAEIEQRNRGLFESAALEEIIDLLGGVCRNRQAEALLAASEAGERLVGALLFADKSLHAWEPGDERVVVIDGVVATDLAVRNAAAHALTLGAHDAYGVVVAMLVGTAASSPEPLSELVTLQNGHVTTT